MSNPDETTTEAPPKLADLPPTPESPKPTDGAQLFAQALNKAVSAAQASGVDQATILGIVRAVEFQVEAPFRLMAQRSAQQWFNATQGGNN